MDHPRNDETGVQRPLELYNGDSSNDIPAWGVCEITDSSIDGQRTIWTVQRPTADSIDPCLVVVNGPTAIPVGGYGAGTQDWPTYALYDTGDTPAVGDALGTQADSFELLKGNSGFCVVGGAIGSGANSRVLVRGAKEVNPSYVVQLKDSVLEAAEQTDSDEVTAKSATTYLLTRNVSNNKLEFVLDEDENQTEVTIWNSTQHRLANGSGATSDVQLASICNVTPDEAGDLYVTEGNWVKVAASSSSAPTTTSGGTSNIAADLTETGFLTPAGDSVNWTHKMPGSYLVEWTANVVINTAGASGEPVATIRIQPATTAIGIHYMGANTSGRRQQVAVRYVYSVSQAQVDAATQFKLTFSQTSAVLMSAANGAITITPHDFAVTD